MYAIIRLPCNHIMQTTYKKSKGKEEWLYTYGGGLTMITKGEPWPRIYYIDALRLINLSDKLSAKPKGEDGGRRQLSKPHDDGLLLLPLNYGPLFSPPLPCKGILSLSALPNPLLMWYNKKNSLPHLLLYDSPPPIVRSIWSNRLRRAMLHTSQGPWPWKLWKPKRKCPKVAVPTHLPNHVVLSRTLRSSVKSYVTGPSTKRYSNEFLFMWVLTHDNIE